MSDFYPIRDGDILLVEGNFLDAKGETALSFSSNYISMEYGSATFSETYPDGSAFNKVETGMRGQLERCYQRCVLYFGGQSGSRQSRLVAYVYPGY